MKRPTLALVLMLMLGTLTVLATSSTAAHTPAGASRPITVLAIVGDQAINPLHAEFRTRDGRDPRYPAGMPTPIRIPLPKAQSFPDAIAELERGPLGHPKPGALYALAGTRLLIHATPGSSGLIAAGTDPQGDLRAHGTATTAAAAGLRTGTSPDSLIVFVPGTGEPVYGWVAQQNWIDLASTSVYDIPTTGQCDGNAGARLLHRNGGLLFSSAGNTTDYYEPLSSPNGLPAVFQVGGVDSKGRTWLPGQLDAPSPFLTAGNVVRPYEVGARYSFNSAAPDSFNGQQVFGGTSGATPTIAGYGAELITEARRLLGSNSPRSSAALARRQPGHTIPSRGPLADGQLTRDELVDLLHRTATPYETAGPARYAIEGYGAADARSLRLAIQILRGQAPLPNRAEEDASHAQAENLRAVLTSRCTN